LRHDASNRTPPGQLLGQGAFYFPNQLFLFLVGELFRFGAARQCGRGGHSLGDGVLHLVEIARPYECLVAVEIFSPNFRRKKCDENNHYTCYNYLKMIYKYIYKPIKKVCQTSINLLVQTFLLGYFCLHDLQAPAAARTSFLPPEGCAQGEWNFSGGDF
jgi:hypothetical protein